MGRTHRAILYQDGQPIIDQYRVKTDKRSGIVNDPNNLDDERYIVRLIGQVITVSLETVEIVNGLPPPEPVSYFDEEPTEPPSPRCPHHNLPLYRVTVPEGYREAGREFLVCPKKAECKYYQPVEADEPHEARAGQPESPRLSIRPATQDAGRRRAFLVLPPNRGMWPLGYRPAG